MNARALILAAGHSTRMGHPKALTDLDGQTALARIVEACEAAGLARPLVVVGFDAASIRAHHAHLEVDWATNPAPDAGRTGSIQCGLRAAPDGDSILLAPIDHPLVSATTLRTLMATSGEVVIPTFEGRGGHPIRLGRVAQSAILESDPATPLRDALRGIPTTRVPVDDPGIHANLDTPADVARALGAGRAETGR